MIRESGLTIIELELGCPYADVERVKCGEILQRLSADYVGVCGLASDLRYGSGLALVFISDTKVKI